MIRGRGIPRKYILELTQIWKIRMMLMKRRKVNPTNASITHEKKNTLSRMVMMIRGRGISQKYILELTQIQTLQIIMMIKRRKVNPRNVSITIKHKKNLWRTVVIIRGRGIPQKYISDFDTNTNSLNYDDDEEKESKSNKRIY